MAVDPFDDVLNLEDQYCEEGYREGYNDGLRAGRVEGRSAGLKKGFEKFLEAGRLQGRSMVWANRLPHTEQQQQHGPQSQSDRAETRDERAVGRPSTLPPLDGNSRLEKNVRLLYELVEPGTLSNKNDDEAVNDFDSRLKKAQGKMKVIERAVGELSAEEVGETPTPHHGI